MINIAIVLTLSYLIGSIPTAFIFAKLIKGIDIRTVGSGNIGATNIYRVVGKGPGFLVLLLDILKGAIPVFFIPFIFSADKVGIDPDLYRILLGASVIAGHVWTIFLRFKGGKGVATTTGVALVIAPNVLGVAFIVWVIFFALLRYVSVASIVAAAALPIASLMMKETSGVTVFFTIIGIVGIYKHKSNIFRLIRGEEKKLI